MIILYLSSFLYFRLINFQQQPRHDVDPFSLGRPVTEVTPFPLTSSLYIYSYLALIMNPMDTTTEVILHFPLYKYGYPVDIGDKFKLFSEVFTCYRVLFLKTHNRLVPAQEVHFFYTRSHLSALQSCEFIFSTNFQIIFTF